MWSKFRVARDTVITSAALLWGSYEILHDARPAVLVLVGAMLGIPVVTRVDEITKKIGQQKRDDSNISE